VSAGFRGRATPERFPAHGSRVKRIGLNASRFDGLRRLGEDHGVIVAAPQPQRRGYDLVIHEPAIGWDMSSCIRPTPSRQKGNPTAPGWSPGGSD
jgi:hypothetical protein